MDPEVIAQLEEQLRIMNELLAQQNSMMAGQLGAMQNASGKLNSAYGSFAAGMGASSQATNKYIEAQEKARDKSNESLEKWTARVRLAETAVNTLTQSFASAGNVVGSFAGALLSAEKGFTKYGATADAAAGAAQGLVSMLPVVGQTLGALVGTVGKIASKVVGDALKLTDAIVNLRDETVKTAGTLPLSSEGMLKLANDAKYFGENIQVLGKITQGLGNNLIGLGDTAGRGATKFMEMANVTEETRQRFGRMGVTQERLTELQGEYVKAQTQSGLAYTMQNKSMDQLRRESLKYAENMMNLSSLTGKQAETLQAEQDMARAVMQEKVAQRQDLIELQRIRKEGTAAEAAAFEAKMKEKAEFRDRLVGLVGPEQAAQVMRVIRTGVYDSTSGPLAALGLDFQQVSDSLNNGAKGIDAANSLADKLSSAYDQRLTDLGNAAPFLDEDTFKQIGINSETLGRQNVYFGKTIEERNKLLEEDRAKKVKGASPMDDAIEKARSFERTLQQRYQEFLIEGIKKAAALLNSTNLAKLASDAYKYGIIAAKVALGGLAVATVALAGLKWKEWQASKEAKEAQRQFTKALQQSTAAMRDQTQASRSAASADRSEAAGSRSARAADIQEAGASKKALAADIAEARASTGAARADTAEARASAAAARADIAEAKASAAAARADLAEARASAAAARADQMEAASGGFGGKGLLGKLGKGLKGGAAGIIGGLLLDTASEYAMESGHDKLGAGLNVGSSALSGAGTGAMIGSIIPGVGTAVGGALGGVLGGLYGIWQNKDTLFGSGGPGAPGTPSAEEQISLDNQDLLEKQLGILSSITMPGNGQDIAQNLSPEQLAALGVTTGNQYTVKKGDTLENIAKQFGISTDELLAANPVVKSKDWKEGYKLNVPGGGTGAGQYTIQSGDTLSELAEKYGVSVEDLMKANPNITDANKIYAGNQLNLPGQSGNPAAQMLEQINALRAEGKTDEAQAMMQQMQEKVTAMMGPEMATKFMEMAKTGQISDPNAILSQLGSASAFIGQDQLAQLGMQPQMAFARQPGEHAEELMSSLTDYAVDKNAELYTPMFETIADHQDKQATSFNEVSKSMALFKIRTDATNKAFLDLMDAADELYEAMTGRKRDRSNDGGDGGGTGSTGGNTVGAVDPDKIKQAQAFFESKGWTKEQAAGLVGNLITESKLNPTAVGDNGKAYGIAQWHPDRQAKFAQEYGKDIKNSTFEEQLEFVDWELRNNEKAAGQSLAGARSASEAAAIIDKQYERSSGAALAERQANAERISSGNFGGLVGATKDATRAIRGLGNGSTDIVSLGRRLQQENLRISEHPSFGGVTPGVHKGRGHAEGRAIDVNIGTGNTESANPAMNARFDQLAGELRNQGYTVLWKQPGHYGHMHVESKNMPYAEKGGIFKGPDSGYLAMLHGKEAVVPLDNKFTRSQSSEEYTVNGKKVGKREYDSFMKSHPELQNLQDKVKSMLTTIQSGKNDPAKLMHAASSLMDTNLAGIKDEVVDKNKKIQDSLIQMVNTETNKAIKAVNDANLPMQTMANQMSMQMRKVMEAHTQSMNELAYRLTDMVDALNTSNDTTKKILKKASA